MLRLMRKDGAPVCTVLLSREAGGTLVERPASQFVHNHASVLLAVSTGTRCLDQSSNSVSAAPWSIGWAQQYTITTVAGNRYTDFRCSKTYASSRPVPIRSAAR